MRNSRLISVVIILICLLVCCSIIMVAYSDFNKLKSSQARLEHYKNAPRDLLDPDISPQAESRAGGSTILGRLIIPRLDLNVMIRTDTVNAYNSVYHYTESVMPGSNGDCGLLGHRTTYSGPFRHITSLKVGDTVIIQDEILSKKYVYQVVSTGNDIRWDYRTNPVKFSQDGEPRLMLITCHPAGTSNAAWITHCKLVSTSEL